MTIATEGAAGSASQDGGRFGQKDLEAFTTAALVALGAPPATASQVATSLVLSNLVGHDSHGFIRLVQYSGWVTDGQIRPAAQPEVSQRQHAIAVIDGNWGFGQSAARLAVDVVSEAAAGNGVAAVTIRDCNHVGRLGEYVTALADQGLVGLSFCNAGPVVAPYGGAGRALGTNPFAWAAPGGAHGPLVVDFSTAGVAEGKLRLAAADGRPIADGLIVDAEGRPSTNADDFYAGGALLPFGGHKGSGMSVLIELLGGLLTGMGTAPTPSYGGGNGAVLMALRVGAFVAADSYAAAAEQFREQLVTVGRGAAPGPVLLPGEIEARTQEQRLRDGIPVSPAVLAAIYQVTDGLGVARPAPLPPAR
ncbi:MAG TPA: Ldh family oxidoreductase [Streptosporangiaceae bacterium]|nr:Ldh family oxidoreductase [Streptosporangiaceae bacterium]